MSVEWLAAVLQPQDVAPHPTFSGKRSVAPLNGLAAFLTGESWRWRYVHTEERANAPTGKSTIDDRDIRTAIACFDIDQIAPSVSTLRRRLELDGAGMSPAKRTALTLIVCAAAVEMDDHSTCFAVLKAASERLAREPRSSDMALLQAAISQQWAFRQYDCGEDHHAKLLEAFNHLQKVMPEACGTFAVSRGVTRTSVATVTTMKANLMSAVESLIAFDDDEWAREVGIRGVVGVVRGENPPIIARVDRLYAENYAANDAEKFKDAFSSGHTRRFGGTAHPDLYFSLLALEFLGHAWSHQARSRLAVFRVMRGLRDPEAADALRLLRHGFDRKNLDLFIQRLRLSGPLDFLSADARQILRHRQGKQIRVPELRVVAAAGELLVHEEALHALDLVKSVVAHGGPEDLPHEWQTAVLREGVAWEAALSVAASCGRLSETALWLLEQVKTRDEDPFMLDRALTIALDQVEWSNVEDNVKQAWAVFGEERGVEFQGLRDALLDSSGGQRSPIAPTSPLDEARQLLNQQAAGAPVDSEEYAPYVPAVIDALEQIQEQARDGVFSRHPVSPAEIAALILSKRTDQRLAEALTGVLIDGNVAATMKARALDRLAHPHPPFNEAAKAAFFENRDRLLSEPGPDLWEDQRTPNPPALRFLAASGILPLNECVLYVSMLLDAAVHARREAARTLVTFTEHRFDETWVILSLALARDEDIQTRALAARALVIASGRGTAHVLAVRDAMRRLLTDDGLMGPFYVLDSLDEVPVAIDDALVKEIEVVAQQHPSRRVRERAATLLAK